MIRPTAALSACATARNASMSAEDHTRGRAQSSSPMKPHHSPPATMGTTRMDAAPSPPSTRCSDAGICATRPCTTSPEPSSSIQREKSGA